MDDNECYQRIRELRRVYGKNGLSDLLNVSLSLLEGAFEYQDNRVVVLNEKSAKRVKSGVRLYWKKWMRVSPH